MCFSEIKWKKPEDTNGIKSLWLRKFEEYFDFCRKS